MEKPSREEIRRAARANRGEYILFAIALVTFLGYTAIYTIHAGDQATMTNTFAGITGVLIGLYFVIRRPEEPQVPALVLFLLFSIIVSLMSSVASYNDSTFPPPSKGLFVAASTTFVLSTAYFAFGLELFGRIAQQKRKG